MPCFKGLAVSIHGSNGPLPEFSIQKQSRQSRIASYIPVPTPKLDPETGRLEPSTFAVSITLLTPGQAVPYSTPKSTDDNPNPSPKLVGGLPGLSDEPGRYAAGVGPYIPLTSSNNETVAAYIHFDGRAKEEVATLLRRSEETWVNSRWVSVPDSEGGGLAEREFLFKEVGLERWLSGMDLTGSKEDVAARVARRKARLEKKRRKRLDEDDSDMNEDPISGRKDRERGSNRVLRYGQDKVEDVSQDDEMFTDSDSDDEEPIPEAAGQIKVALFRVLASGEVKRGEYSPQFDAHDDDEMNNPDDPNADVDHTTTFAQPKTLDPKTISTQTVTGIDAPDSPFATFTFFYRGQKQLQKMGILPTSGQQDGKTSTTVKRKSGQLDFGSLAPLKNKGTIGFAGYRDTGTPRKGINGKVKSEDDMDSDDEELSDTTGPVKRKAANGSAREVEDDDADAKQASTESLSAEELQRRGELADGVSKMKLKRQHSAEPPSVGQRRSAEPNSGSITPPTASSSFASASNMPVDPAATSGARSNHTPHASTSAPSNLSSLNTAQLEPSDLIGSPLKKQRPSIPEDNDVTPKAAVAGGKASIAAAAAPTGAMGAFASPALGGFGGGNTAMGDSMAASQRLADAVKETPAVQMSGPAKVDGEDEEL
ncbi:hypothetical protein FH972_021668 [Carpinus fangiana]|uniref:DUF7918 domain-containing protein n=1 Tax=Carpinus fangiana TaxID=176857 RepID=A0A5N6KQJ7_9ROSI|nr:hypothetical protein FH972_021668 [Carpinus fangiana]